MTMRYKIALQHSEEGVSASVPGLPGCWSQGRDEQELIRELFDAAIRGLDRHLGQLMEALKARQLCDDALTVVVSDHGETLYARDALIRATRLRSPSSATRPRVPR